MTSLVRRVAAPCAAALLLSLGAAGFAADTASTAGKPVIVEVSGEELYGHICQGCHMPQGQGAVGAGHYPKLAGDPALVSWQYVAMTVLNGRNGMPSFGEPTRPEEGAFGAVHLSDQQVADVVNYIRSHFDNQYGDKVTATQVAKLPHPGGRLMAGASSPQSRSGAPPGK
jgi:mono/diheme cytochrome c family protein